MKLQTLGNTSQHLHINNNSGLKALLRLYSFLSLVSAFLDDGTEGGVALFHLHRDHFLICEYNLSEACI